MLNGIFIDNIEQISNNYIFKYKPIKNQLGNTHSQRGKYLDLFMHILRINKVLHFASSNLRLY